MPDGTSELRLRPEVGISVAAARAELERAVQLGGLQNDPLRYPLQALSLHLEVLHRLCEDVTLTLESAAEEAKRAPIAIGSEIAGAGHAAAIGAIASARRMVWSEVAKVVLLAVAVLAASNAATGGIFWWLGHRAEKVEVESAIARTPGTAVQRGAKGAPIWLAQMQPNDTEASLASCKRFEEKGLGACRLGLWLEPSPPKSADDAK